MAGWVAVAAIVALNNGVAYRSRRPELMMSAVARRHRVLTCVAMLILAHHWDLFGERPPGVRHPEAG